MKGAVIGCGRMGVFTSPSIGLYAPPFWLPQSHAEAMAAHPEIELIALCDSSAEALRRAGEVYPSARMYEDFAALLATEAPDIIGIATRTIGRAEMIEASLNAGTRALHVEKPLCNSVAELDRLQPLLERDDTFLTYGTLRRFFSIYRRAVQIASSGQLGKLVEIRVDGGAGSLFWTHPHSVDLILLAAGRRRAVAAQAFLGDITRTRHDVIENDPVVLSASIWFEDGVAGHFGRAIGSSFHIHCERGSVSIFGNGQRLVVKRLEGDDPYPVDALEEGPTANEEGSLAPIIELIAASSGDPDAIARNRKTKNAILTGQRILFALAQSGLDGGRLVELSDVDPGLTIWARTNGAPA